MTQLHAHWRNRLARWRHFRLTSPAQPCRHHCVEWRTQPPPTGVWACLSVGLSLLLLRYIENHVSRLHEVTLLAIHVNSACGSILFWRQYGTKVRWYNWHRGIMFMDCPFVCAWGARADAYFDRLLVLHRVPKNVHLLDSEYELCQKLADFCDF